MASKKNKSRHTPSNRQSSIKPSEATLILHRYSQHSIEQLQKVLKQLNISTIAIWTYDKHCHPYIINALKQTSQLYPNIQPTYESLKSYVQKHNNTHIVFAFESLNEDMDRMLKRAGIHMLPPLWFVSGIQIRTWYRQYVKIGKRMSLRTFYEKQCAEQQIPLEYRKSTDPDNRDSMSHKAVSQFNHLNTQMILPVNHKQAQQLLQDFINTKLNHFARYEDAIVQGEHKDPRLYHSGLSMALNIGLITPKQVFTAIVKQGFSNDTEAFLRQMIGWREYAICYYKYAFDRQKMESIPGRGLSNVWYAQHYKKYQDQLDKIPYIKDVLIEIWTYGYTHHINRLVLLSFMIQLKIKPKYIYDWMNQHFVDANDWVMAFNVYAMGHYDTRFTRKQYIFSSNYIKIQSGGAYKHNQYLDNLYHHYTKTKYDHHMLKAITSLFTIIE